MTAPARRPAPAPAPPAKPVAGPRAPYVSPEVKPLGILPIGGRWLPILRTDGKVALVDLTFDVTHKARTVGVFRCAADAVKFAEGLVAKGVR